MHKIEHHRFKSCIMGVIKKHNLCKHEDASKPVLVIKPVYIKQVQQLDEGMRNIN